MEGSGAAAGGQERSRLSLPEEEEEAWEGGRSALDAAPKTEGQPGKEGGRRRRETEREKSPEQPHLGSPAPLQALFSTHLTPQPGKRDLEREEERGERKKKKRASTNLKKRKRGRRLPVAPRTGASALPGRPGAQVAAEAPRGHRPLSPSRGQGGGGEGLASASAPALLQVRREMLLKGKGRRRARLGNAERMEL
ncbi:octapeptide-repeat protein T2-like [Phaenicophaeus curvirostris]|uniref:octapeptide-repeat protein T2-like n=1 Tax=Phaenicophaeus curvirostris TaxID=33595 RepID=UPI0037F0A144